MKKLLAIGGIIVLIFIAIVFLSNKSDEAKLQDNPYGTDDLKKSTIDLIGNEHYQNIVMPDELFEKIESGESVTAYYFSPECQYCQEMTPRLMPIAEKNNVHVYQYNMLEFGEEANSRYGIDGWPALVQYKDGKEVGRMVGSHPDEEIQAFFDEFKE